MSHDSSPARAAAGHGHAAGPGANADAISPEALAAIRAELPGLDRTTYLNTGTLGPSPRRVTERLFQLYRDWQEAGPGVPDVYEAMAAASLTAKEPVAAFFGVTAAELALTDNSTDGINVVANGIKWETGDEVIISDQEHPAGLLIWLHLRQTKGVRIRIARLSPLGSSENVEEVESLITPRTRLLAISHVSSMTGLRLPARSIAATAHAHNVPVLFDGAQAAGQFPLDLRDIGCDFYALNGHKWLLGPIGSGALFCSKDALVDLVPDRVGGGSTETYTYAEDGALSFWPTAHRFEFATRCHPLWQAWPTALDFLGEVGLPAIEARGQTLARRLRGALAAIPGVTVVGPGPEADPDLFTAAVTCRLEGVPGRTLYETLLRRFGVAGRTVAEHEAVRFSCAFFNTEEEIERAIRAVTTLAREGAA